MRLLFSLPAFWEFFPLLSQICLMERGNYRFRVGLSFLSAAASGSTLYPLVPCFLAAVYCAPPFFPQDVKADFQPTFSSL